MFRITMLPAEDGDCFFIETGSRPHRLLIDGGRAKTANGPIIRLLDGLDERNDPALDLLVLSHIDADHIEGLLELVELRPELKLGGIWFNGLAACNAAAGTTAPPREIVSPSAKQACAQVLSVLQGERLTSIIHDRNWAWNEGWENLAVMIGQNGPLPAIHLDGETRLTLFGPTRAKLAALSLKWEETVRTEIGTGRKAALAGRRAPARHPGRDIGYFAEKRDDPDTALPNGTSIAFVIESAGKSALFTADAHPDDMVAALERYCPGEDRVRFDAIKVAHHGSAANNTSALLDRLQSPLWLFSSNGSRHGHPDPEAVARIVQTPERKRLVFNYRSSYSEGWEDSRAEKDNSYSCQFPVEPGDFTVIDLEPTQLLV